MSLPFLSWILAPCFIGLQSIYNKSSHLTLMGFHQNALRNFQTCLKLGLVVYSSLLGLPIFIHYFIIFSLNSPLARVHCSLPLKVYEILIILGLGMQQRDPRLGSFILDFKGYWMLSPQHTCYLRPKVLFSKRAFFTWAYDSNQAMVL